LRSPDALVLCGLLLLLAVLSLRIAGQSPLPERGERPRRSVSSARPGGWKALYLLLGRRGLAAQKIERAPRDWPKDLRVLVTGEAYPGSPWTEKEVQAALRWVGEDRTLILLTGRWNELLDQLRLGVRQGARSDAILFPLQPAPFLSGVDGLRVPGTARFGGAPHGAVPLFADDHPAVLLMRYRGGTVLVISDPAVADNQHLTQADNARFLTSLISAYAGAGGRVGFDEYHQGFQAADSLWDAIGRPGQLAAGQILGLVLLLAYSAGRRFGLPRPLPAPARVSSEYVASLADLYRRARAADAALEGVYLSFWRDLCRAVALPYDAPTDEVVRRAARTLGAGDRQDVEERLRRVVNECEAKIETAKVAERDLVPLARDLETLREELGIGGDNREPAAHR
jgi:hypothetical protein